MDRKVNRVTDATVDFFEASSALMLLRCKPTIEQQRVLADCKTPLFFSFDELFVFGAERRDALIRGRLLLPSAHIVKWVRDLIVQTSCHRNR